MFYNQKNIVSQSLWYTEGLEHKTVFIRLYDRGFPSLECLQITVSVL